MCEVHHLPGRELCALCVHCCVTELQHCLMYSKGLHKNTLSPLAWCLRLKKAWDILAGSEETPGRSQVILGEVFPHGSSEAFPLRSAAPRPCCVRGTQSWASPSPTAWPWRASAGAFTGTMKTLVLMAARKHCQGWGGLRTFRAGQSSPTAGLRHPGGTASVAPASCSHPPTPGGHRTGWF